MNSPEAPHIPGSLPRSVFLLLIFPSRSPSDSKRSPNAPEQNPDRPRTPGASSPFERQAAERRAKSNKKTCARTFVRAPAEPARAPGSPRRRRRKLQSAKGFECAAFSSEVSTVNGQRKGYVLMLARRAERQKPCPALSFQNAEQGFF